MIDRQTYTATLPDGSTVNPISGKITLDNNWSPYCQATIKIPTPASLAPFDPRTDTEPPRVKLGAFQEFNESEPLSTFTSSFAHLSDITAAFAHLSDITAAMVHDTWDNAPMPAGNYRTFDLAIISATSNSDGTTDLKLSSDEAFLVEQVVAPQIAQAVYPPALDLREIIQYYLTAMWSPAVPAWVDSFFNYSLASLVTGVTVGIPAYQSLWSFLDTYVQLAGGRLWCDELRRWHLEPAPTSSPGAVVIDASSSAVQWSNEISRETTWYNVVDVVYSWTDAANVAQRSKDEAVGPGVVNPFFRALVIERPVPAPGHGAAAAILARVLTYGNDPNIEAVNDFSITPGQAGTITLPTGVFTGVIGAVSWDIGAAEMSVTPRQLI